MAGRSAQLRHDSGPVRHAVPHVSSTILIPAPAFGSGFRISNSEDPAPNLLDPDRRTLSRNHRRDDIEFTGNVASRKNVNERSVHSAEGVEPAASVGPSVGIKARCSHLARTRQRKRRPGSAKTSELRCCRASTGRGRASTPTPPGQTAICSGAVERAAPPVQGLTVCACPDRVSRKMSPFRGLIDSPAQF